MRRIAYSLLALIIVGILYSMYQSTPCKEPSDIEIRFQQIQCSLGAINDPSLVERVCAGLGRPVDCSLTDPNDNAVIEKALKDIINDCAKKNLEKDNLCTDRVKDIP